MKKSIVLCMAALTLTATQVTPVPAQTRPNVRAFSVNACELKDALNCDSFSELRDVLKDCDVRYGGVFVNGKYIPFPSGDVTKPEDNESDCVTKPEDNNSDIATKPENDNSDCITTPENNNSGNVEKPEDNNSGNITTPEDNNSNDSVKPDDNNSGNTTTPEDSNSGSTENTPNNSDLTFIRQVIGLVNQERVKAGVSPLTMDAGLNNAAMVRAKEIQTSFSHTRPNGSNFSTVLKEANVTYRRSGENIAWGQRSPEAVVNAWMNSSGHRANILNENFGRIGVGYLTNNSGTPYWVQLFAD